MKEKTFSLCELLVITAFVVFTIGIAYLLICDCFLSVWVGLWVIIDHYQTLITGIIAIIAAKMSVNMMQKQLNENRRFEYHKIISNIDESCHRYFDCVYDKSKWRETESNHISIAVYKIKIPPELPDFVVDRAIYSALDYRSRLNIRTIITELELFDKYLKSSPKKYIAVAQKTSDTVSRLVIETENWINR